MMLSPWLVTILALWMLLVVTGAEDNSKRSPEYPTFNEVKSQKLASFRVKNTDCVLKMRGDQCEMVYIVKSGTCQLMSTVAQLFPGLDIKASTSNLIIPEKFALEKMKVNRCQGKKENGLVTFKATSSESQELVPQLLTLGVETQLTLKWNTNIQFTAEKLEVALKGRTTIGKDKVTMKVEKETGADYELTAKMQNLNVIDFFTSFQINIDELIDPELTVEKTMLGLSSVVLKKPRIRGVFSPSGGFELTATGKIAAPELAADANQLYVFVQKSSGPSAPIESFRKPIGGFFATFENENVQNTIMSLTGVPVPKIAIFERVNRVGVTAATGTVYSINSKQLNQLVTGFLPMEGLDLLPKGLHVLHFAPNSNPDFKDRQNKQAERIFFRCEVGKGKLAWKSTQRMESHLVRFTSLVWSSPKGVNSLALKPNTAGIFDSIDFIRKTKDLQVNFNLTERVPVLQNGLVSLLNSTINLYTKHNGQGAYNGWLMKGSGEETILDERVQVKIYQMEHRTNVKASANIFDMETLRNRTRAESLRPELRKAFPFTQIFQIDHLGYEASFEWNTVLKLKGHVLLSRKPNLEILYFIRNTGPQLKVALLFKNEFLHNVANLIYGEKIMSFDWMKFKTVAVVMKQGGVRGQHYHPFDRKQFQKVDKSFDTGIGFAAEQLNLRGCAKRELKMCTFLKKNLRKSTNIIYYGQMLKEVMKMSAKMQWKITFGRALEFVCKGSRLRLKKDGNRLVFDGNMIVKHTSETFPGKIYDDGTDILMLEFGGRAEDESDKILNLGYAKLRPIRAKFPISPHEKINVIYLQSRLSIGTVASEQIEFSGGTGRQFIRYTDSDLPHVKFVGTKATLKYKKILKAFGAASPSQLLIGAAFRNRAVIGYTSIKRVWHVPEYDVKIQRGLHFYGKLTIKTGETYKAVVNILDNLQVETVIKLNPLKYGKVTKSKEGKVSFQYVNLFLHETAERPELGPRLIISGADQRIEGYCTTVGLEGKFSTQMLRRNEIGFDYQISLKGRVYRETDVAEIVLTTKGEDKPSDFRFKYRLDLTKQAASNVNENLVEILRKIMQDATKGRDKVHLVFLEAKRMVESYRDMQRGYSADMESLQRQIHSFNSGIDKSVLAISADCIDLCRTVAIPGIEWQHDCIRQAGGKKNIKCMKWAADKEKAVNVICMLKCEAKKIVAAGKAADKLWQIRTLINRYRQRKVLFQNVGKLIDLALEAKNIARNAKVLVASKAGLEKEIRRLLSTSEGSEGLVDITILKVDENIESLRPPCLPFLLEFSLNTVPPKSYSGKERICFNGEFFKNVGTKVMRLSFPKINEMFRVLEEAEMQYSRIDAIKKSLGRVMEETQKPQKRSNVNNLPIDLVDRSFSRIANRRIPKFTVKGDFTRLAFQHYSPWAIAKRSNVLEVQSPGSGQKQFDMLSLEGKAACQQVKGVIAQYKHIADNINTVALNYHSGKELYGKHKNALLKGLGDSHVDILSLMNETKLTKFEKNDMMYWYDFTKKGMQDYVQTLNNRLKNHNNKGLQLLRNELASFYGGKGFLDQLENFGSKAVTLSKMEIMKRDKQTLSLNNVNRDLKQLLFADGKTLDDAVVGIKRLSSQISNVEISSLSCY